MKVLVEISDEQVVEVLRYSALDAFSTLKFKTPMPSNYISDMEDVLAYCAAVNKVIEWFGGNRVELSKAEGWKAII